MKKVYLLILFYNGVADLRECLPTLRMLENRKYLLKTVVIDNGSNFREKKELAKLLKIYQDIKLITNKFNLGFAKGNNIGINYALKQGADYAVLLNNDTKIENKMYEGGNKLWPKDTCT